MIEAGSPCTSRSLNEAEVALEVSLPPRIRDLYEAGDGRYHLAGQWWVAWPLDRVVSDNRHAWAGAYGVHLPRHFIALGDDGTGDPFCVPTSGEDRVARWSWILGEVDSEVGTLTEFTEQWLR